MNLQENISRIKEVMGLLNEEFDEVMDLSDNYSSDVEKLQKLLVSKNYDIGDYGPNKDGIDGKYGRKTRRAHRAFLKGISAENFNQKSEKKLDDISFNPEDTDVVIFMAGLESSKNKENQSNILQKALLNKKIITHSYTDFSGLKKSLEEFPDSYVILFSKACESSSKVANLMNNKRKLFIVEPYAKKGNKSVVDAVNKGVPSTNVIVAPNSTERGTGVIKGATVNTIGGHFDALKFVANLLK